MSADHDHDENWAFCGCAHCMAPGEDVSSGGDRSYTIPEPPKIPAPPGSTPKEEDPGYQGPKFHTLLRGDDWNGALTGTSVVVPYSFATRSVSYYGGAAAQVGFDPMTGEALDVTQRANIREALALWEQVSGIVFVEVPDSPVLEFNGIRFLLETMSEGLLGLALPNAGATYGFNIFFGRDYYHNDPMARGTDAFVTSVHEIGHAIGLKHPFHGWPNLSKSDDTTKNTVMSYTDGKNYDRLGPVDVAAAQYIYGTNEAADAAAIRWAHGPGGSLITTANDQANAIISFDNRDIVLAGGGDDYIVLRGGDDDVSSGAGNDAIFGGAGVDALSTGVLRRQAAVEIGPDQGTVATHDGTDTYYQVEILRFTDGDLHLHGAGAAGQAYRLYGAALGRAPDPIGLGHWARALESGATNLANAAADFVGSAEFAARYGAPDAAGFVSLLYQNVLGRAADAYGLKYWTDVMQKFGVGHAGVLLGFSESVEHKQKTAAAFTNGLWVADPEAVDVLRAYVALLDRRPDAEGLSTWTAAREAWLGQPELVARLVSSAEFQDRFGGLSNRDFVEHLYHTALDRSADAGGLAAWVHVLDAGLDTRAGVALGFANSAEMTAKLTPMVADGILFA